MDAVRRVIMSVMSILLFVGFAACAVYMFMLFDELEAKSRLSVHTLDDENITFTLTSRWKLKEGTDKSLSFVNADAIMEMHVYKKSELDLVHASDLLELKISERLQHVDVYSLSENFGANHVNDRIIHSRLYLVEKNEMQTQYYFTVMEFAGSETYIFVLYETRESFMRYHLNNINRMLRRIQWNGEEIDLAMF